MPYDIERLDRVPAAFASVGRVESGPGADSDVDGHIAAGGAGGVYKADMDLAKGYPDIPGVHQPEEHPILYVFIAGENIEEAGGGGAEIDRE